MRSKAIRPPVLAPKTAAGARSSARMSSAASSACSPTDVAVQPRGRGPRELPRRSYVITVKSPASKSAVREKLPVSPVDPVISSSVGPSPCFS